MIVVYQGSGGLAAGFLPYVHPIYKLTLVYWENVSTRV